MKRTSEEARPHCALVDKRTAEKRCRNAFRKIIHFVSRECTGARAVSLASEPSLNRSILKAASMLLLGYEISTVWAIVFYADEQSTFTCLLSFQGEANAMLLTRQSELDKLLSEDFLVSAFTPLLMQQPIDELAREIFCLLDYNQKGFIEEGNLVRAAQENAPGMTEITFGRALSDIIKEHNGRLGYLSLKKILADGLNQMKYSD